MGNLDGTSRDREAREQLAAAVRACLDRCWVGWDGWSVFGWMGVGRFVVVRRRIQRQAYSLISLNFLLPLVAPHSLLLSTLLLTAGQGVPRLP